MYVEGRKERKGCGGLGGGRGYRKSVKQNMFTSEKHGQHVENKNE